MSSSFPTIVSQQENRRRSIVVDSAKMFFLGGSLLTASLPQLSTPASAQSVATAMTHAPAQAAEQPSFKTEGSGTLLAMAASGKSLGQCPLEHTDVTATISGYVARVKVK